MPVCLRKNEGIPIIIVSHKVCVHMYIKKKFKFKTANHSIFFSFYVSVYSTVFMYVSVFATRVRSEQHVHSEVNLLMQERAAAFLTERDG